MNIFTPLSRPIAIQIALLALLGLAGSGVATAQGVSGDAALFSASGGAPPNILLLLDSSGSMGKAPAGCDGCDIKRRMANRAIYNLVTAVNPPDGKGGYIGNARLGFAIFTKDGARLLVPIGDNTVGEIVTWVSDPDIATAAENIKKIGGNSHGLAMMEMGRYFAHDQSWGPLPPWGFASNGTGDYPAFTGTYTGTADPTDFPFEDPSLPSPWDLACRPSFLIHIDDGLWGGNDGGRFGNCNGTTCPLDFIGDISGDGDFWMEDISQKLFETDFSDETKGGFKGNQNVVTYVIGFDEPNAVDLMKITAEVGGGSFFFATNEVELEEALFNITITIFESVASFAGVAVPSSRSSSGASLYNAYFEPRNNRSIWAGHLEAYGLGKDGAILDKDGDPASDPDTGLLVDPPNPYWDAGVELLTKTDRKIYTMDSSGDAMIVDARNLGVDPHTGDINVTVAELALSSAGGSGGSGGTGGGAGGTGGGGGGTGGTGGSGGTGGGSGACGPHVAADVPEGWDFQMTEPAATLPDVLLEGKVKFKYCVPPSRKGLDKDNFGTYPIDGEGGDGIDVQKRKKDDAVCTYAGDGITVTGGWKEKDLNVGKETGLIHIRYYKSKKGLDKKGKLKDLDDFSTDALVGFSVSACVTADTTTPSGGTPPVDEDANPDFAPFPNASTSGIDTYDELLESVVNFLYGRDGFAEDEADREKMRDVVLGDIFHSTPLVIGQPSRAWLQESGNGFPDFRALYEDRDRVIFAGANDGMLHAFHAGDWKSDLSGTPSTNEGDDPNTTEIENGYYTQGTGTEVFGYVPRVLLPKIKYLSHNIPRSTYFVDAPPTAADAFIDADGDGSAEWTTVLISGLREGGEGYAALDVTDPAAPSSPTHGHPSYPNVLWEFTHAKLGQSWSQAAFARIKVRPSSGTADNCGYSDGDGACEEKWVAIFGGGYDPVGDPNRFTFVGDHTDPLWTAKSKAIFMVDLETGSVLQMLAHDETDTANLARMDYAIPSRPSVLDRDFDGFADVVYVGDLGGQMWKWEISAVAEDSNSDGVFDEWYSGVFFDAGVTTLSSGDKHYRSFFSPPAATFMRGKLHLAFGSGEREELRWEGTSADDENRFYVVIDDSVPGSDPLDEDRFTSASTDAVMTEADIIDSDITNLSTDPYPYPVDHGFFYKATEGEKFITDVAIFGGHVITASYTPTKGADLCTTAGGQAFLHAFNVGTGRGAFGDTDTAADPANDRRFLVGGGLPSNPRVSMAPDPDDDAIYIKTSTGQIIVIDDKEWRDDVPAQAIYWRQKY